MNDFTEKQLREEFDFNRLDTDPLEMVQFCLRQIFESKSICFDDATVPGPTKSMFHTTKALTFEELVGALLAAEHVMINHFDDGSSNKP